MKANEINRLGPCLETLFDNAILNAIKKHKKNLLRGRVFKSRIILQR